MKAPSAGGQTTPSQGGQNSGSAGPAAGLIHPVVIYPFRPPSDYRDLEELYQMVARLDSDRKTYARPITVIDRKTQTMLARNKRFHEFRNHKVAACSDILDAWCVDTCQMWYSGLGAGL